jgi:uncharacterized protein
VTDSARRADAQVRWSPSGEWEPDEPWAGSAETHTAVVFFAGDRAYKLKKPVQMAFLDFRDRAARRADCESEVTLNRRLSPDVYLGVAELRGQGETEGEPVVVMRRMPRRRRLSTLVTDGEDVDEALRDAARRIAALHASSAPRHDLDLAALTERLWREGFEQLREVGRDVLDPAELAECERLATAYVVGRRPLLAERERAGRVRDGHGDLLADDVFCLDDGVRILDCLEFDAALRLGDVLADAAFLAMDLDRLGRADLARRFLDDYARYSAESHPASLGHHYVAYRAFVRTKVECLRAAQGDSSAADRARRLLTLTTRRLRAGEVRLLLLGGLPATGKSTLAADLAGRAAGTGRPWVLLRSDVVRKELAGLPSTARADSDFGTGAYEDARTEATYAEMLRRASVALERGESVVLDASFSRQQHRAAARDLGRRHACEVVEVRATCPEEVSAERIRRRRAAGTDASDATVEVLAAMSAAYEDWPEATPIDTSGPAAEGERALDRVLDRVLHRALGPTGDDGSAGG